MSNTKKIAVRIVKSIIADLKDRRGIGDEFDSIDVDTQREIRRTWEEMIVEELEERTRQGAAR